jgi:hypothetical protein
MPPDFAQLTFLPQGHEFASEPQQLSKKVDQPTAQGEYWHSSDSFSQSSACESPLGAFHLIQD